jgi:signal transduction histidine kinase
MASLRWQVELLLRGARAGHLEPERLVAALEAIGASATEAICTMDEFHNLMRRGDSNPVLQSCHIDLVEFVRRHVVAWGQPADFNMQLERGGAPLIVKANGVSLRRVLNNLLDNAVKYSPSHGQIHVHVKQEQRDGRAWAVLAVADQGVGIPPENLDRIFEAFWRGNVPQGTPGEGLGLASVRMLVTAEGGHTEVESEVGVGSTFRVWLPLVGTPRSQWKERPGTTPA